MARYVPQKTCSPNKGCGKDFPETAAYFRPKVGKYAGCFEAYCRECDRRVSREYQARRVMARASRPKPTSEPHGAERRCKSALGCGRLLRDSDFYKGQSLCKACYKARWLPRLREKRRRASMDIVHGNTDGREGPLAADAEPLLACSGHAMFSEEAVHVGLQAAFSGEGGHEPQAEIVGYAQAVSYTHLTLPTNREV